ncbi:hypothetical protein ID866_8702 [Astraeus odoratus]|nr:hypothetical protein ID866_8702 [Astraeus odoratus]
MVSTSDTQHDRHDRCTSALPPEIEEQISLVEHHVHALGVALHELRKMCPLIEDIPRIGALADTAEDNRTQIRENVRMIRDRLRVPFTIIEADFENEWAKKMKSGIVEARAKSGQVFMRGQVQHGPATDTSTLARGLPYSLSVEHSDDSDYSEWRAPYRVQFTPAAGVQDSEGHPFPAVCVEVDEKGMASCSYKEALRDRETGKTVEVDEETLKGPTPVESVDWKLQPVEKTTSNTPREPIPRVVKSSSVELVDIPLRPSDVMPSFTVGASSKREREGEEQGDVGERTKKQKNTEVDVPRASF